MTYESFVSRLGFNEDPFAFTDADRESRLSDYFVDPPDFAGVMGTPTSPEPTIVFAPRGAGKSALRKMVEQESTNAVTPYLCILYGDFEALGGRTPSLSEHQTNLSRLLTIAILSELEGDEGGQVYLSDHDKQVLKSAARQLLSGLTADQYKAAIGSIKSSGDKAGDLWRKHGGVLAVVVGALMAKAGIEGVPVPAPGTSAVSSADLAGSRENYFGELIQITRRLFWSSVYILVDRVDETTATASSPSAALDVIVTLLTNLPMLQHPDVGFKFFLWDQLEPQFMERGGRPDKVMVFSLRWKVSEIQTMLSKRLTAFSDGRVTNFNDLVEDGSGVDVHRLLAYLCHGSPRDMIRMAKQMIAEATRSDTTIERIPIAAVWAGMHTFSRKRATELYGKHEKDFSKFQDASFVTNHLASNVFRISDNAMRQKLQQWTEVGAIRKMTELPTGKNRPKYVYTFTDLRVILARSPVEEVPLILGNFALICPRCGRIVIGSNSSLVCECGADVTLESDPSLLETCSF